MRAIFYYIMTLASAAFLNREDNRRRESRLGQNREVDLSEVLSRKRRRLGRRVADEQLREPRANMSRPPIYTKKTKRVHGQPHHSVKLCMNIEPCRGSRL